MKCLGTVFSLVVGIIILPLAISCGGSAGDFSGANKTSRPDKNGLPFVGLTRSLVSKEKRFAGYSKRAGRLSIIDPVSETEISSFSTVGSYELALPLEGFDGIALIGRKNVEIVSNGLSRKYELGEWVYRASAKESSALAFSVSDGRTYLLRNLQANTWQSQFFTNPFNEVSSSAANYPFFTDDGNQMVLFRSRIGAYAVYSARSSTEEISNEGSVCTDQNPVTDSLDVTAVRYDGKKSILFTGDRSGKLSGALIGDGTICTNFSSWPNIALGSSILDITVTDSGGLLVTTGDSRFIELTFTDNKFSEVNSHSGLCSLPLLPTLVGTEYIGMICPDTNGGNSLGSASPAILPDYFYDQFASVFIINKETHEIKLSIDLDLNQIGGFAIDSDTSKLYHLEDSAIGVMNVYDFSVPGAVEGRSVSGLFLGGILNQGSD